VLWCEVSLDSGLSKSPLASAPISRGGESIERPDLCYVIQTALSTSGNNYRTGKTTQQDRKVQGKESVNAGTYGMCVFQKTLLKRIQWL